MQAMLTRGFAFSQLILIELRLIVFLLYKLRKNIIFII